MPAGLAAITGHSWAILLLSPPGATLHISVPWVLLREAGDFSMDHVTRLIGFQSVLTLGCSHTSEGQESRVFRVFVPQVKVANPTRLFSLRF